MGMGESMCWLMDGWVDGNGWMDGLVDGWKGRWDLVDGWAG